MNTTTLNMTTLDGGNDIIKRGEGGGSMPTPPSGGESGGGDWHYFDVSEVDLTDPGIAISLAMCYVMVKWTMDDEVGIGAAGVFELVSGFAGPNPPKVLAFGGDYTQRTIFGGKDASYSDVVEELRAVCSFPEITKEQFYNLE